MRGRFVWRIAVLMGVFFALTFAAVSLVVWVVARVAPGGAATALVASAVLILGAVVGVVAVGRALRRVTSPVADVMEAAGRLADGDYTARVAERGPPEVRRLTMAFNRMAARLQAHEEQRRSLLADLAHELRTPLAVIQGNLEALLDGVYPRDDAHLAPVLEETRVLSALIEDLRLLALAETGALALHREPTDLPALIQETAAAFRQQGAESGVTITVEDATAIPTLEIDAVRIRQVLSSLITNALQHTPRGGSITIACRVDGGAVEVRVTDTGEGIAAQDLPRIFERFYKSKTSRGTGLGLTIAKNLVSLHGGRIAAESTVGKGATIRFTLPFGPG
jgi:two-component system OmpR family sensor kinase/two-component system sensor histidine kinase BaeS